MDPSTAMHDSVRSDASRAGGGSIGALFGGLWLVAWWSQAHRSSPALLALILVVVAVVVGAGLVQARRLRRAAGAPAAPRDGRLRRYGLVNAIYWPACLLVVLALGASGHARWINPAIILLVGLHLFPLGWIFRDWLLHAAGLALTALALAYPALAGPGSPVGLLGAGTILLATGAAATVASALPRPRSPHGRARREDHGGLME